MAEIAGVPDEVLEEFSQRRLQVLDHLEREGTSGFYAAKVAAVATRDRKEPLDLPRLREEWRSRAAEQGSAAAELKRLLGRTVERELDERVIAEIAAHLVGPDGLTEKRSTFSGPEAVMAWAEAQQQGAPAERVFALVERFLAREEVQRSERAAVGRPARFSTAELLRHERVALKIATPTRDGRVPVVSRPALEHVFRERAAELGAEQQAMVRAAAATPDRVVCVVGHAGAGKTVALGALAEAFRREGYLALGAAPSGVAAANLEAETGVPSMTLHRLLAETWRRGGLPRECLLLVDEAGMADTRTLTDVLFQVEHADGKRRVGRRPRPARRRRPGRPVRRARRAKRRDRAPRQPPPALRARTTRARAAPRGWKPRLPRTRRGAGQAPCGGDACGGEGGARRATGGAPPPATSKGA